MPPRNVTAIGGSGRQKPIPVYTWIPPSFSPTWKIEIVTKIDTYDVTDLLIDGDYTDGVTNTIGDFRLKIDNSTETYTDLFSVYDTVNIYMDYAATATTKVFTGLIERPSKQDNSVVVTGKGAAIRMVYKNITYAATNKSRSDILSEIVSSYFGGIITTTNVETDNTLVTVAYEDKPFWEIIEEFCSDGEHNAYISVDFDLNYFAVNTRQNDTEAVVHEYNLISTGDFSPDLEGVYNKVKVYGKNFNGIPLIATAQDSTSQSDLNGDIRELKIDASNIDNIAALQARADLELAKLKSPPTVGEVTSLLLPTLLPGEKVRISDPLNGLNPGVYPVQKYTHKFSNDEPPMTTLTIEKERASIPILLKKRVKFESDISESNNPNELDYSIAYDFTTDIGTHSNTEIDTEKGVLSTDGSASGTWISDVVTTSSNILAVEPRVIGNQLGNTKVFISLNGGQNYTETRFLSKTTTINAGTQLRLRIDIAGSTAEITSAGVLYSLA